MSPSAGVWQNCTKFSTFSLVISVLLLINVKYQFIFLLIAVFPPCERIIVCIVYVTIQYFLSSVTLKNFNVWHHLRDIIRFFICINLTQLMLIDKNE